MAAGPARIAATLAAFVFCAAFSCWACDTVEPDLMPEPGPPQPWVPEDNEPPCAPLGLCEEGCVDLETDQGNCGTCGNVCEEDEVCAMGLCTLQADVCESLELTVNGHTKLLVGETVLLTATCWYTTGEGADVTAQVAFASDDPEVLAVSADGVVKGLWVGVASVSATYEDEVSGRVESPPVTFIFEGQQPQ